METLDEVQNIMLRQYKLINIFIEFILALTSALTYVHLFYDDKTCISCVLTQQNQGVLATRFECSPRDQSRYSPNKSEYGKWYVM